MPAEWKSEVRCNIKISFKGVPSSPRLIKDWRGNAIKPESGLHSLMNSPGVTPGNSWWECAVRSPNPWPYFRPKKVIFHQSFYRSQTWPLGRDYVINTASIRNGQDRFNLLSLYTSTSKFESRNQNDPCIATNN